MARHSFESKNFRQFETAGQRGIGCWPVQFSLACLQYQPLGSSGEPGDQFAGLDMGTAQQHFGLGVLWIADGSVNTECGVRQATAQSGQETSGRLRLRKCDSGQSDSSIDWGSSASRVGPSSVMASGLPA